MDPTHRQPVSIEEVARQTLPGMAIPQSIAFSPNDRLVTYLFSPDGTRQRSLFGLDLETGQTRELIPANFGTASEGDLSLEEALRRERSRDIGLGVTRYAWAERAERLLIPLPDGLYVMDGADSPLRLLVACDGEPILDPRFSPDGDWVAYVHHGELHVAAYQGGPPRRLSAGDRKSGLKHGLAEYVAQEEMGRHEGYWWSRDGRRLAYTEVDESHIPVYRIVHQAQDTSGPTAFEDHHYPFAGQENARVRLAVVSVEGGPPVWMDLGLGLGSDPDPDEYLVRAQWLPDGQLAVQLENRHQTRLRLIRFNPNTGQGQSLLEERSETWINLHDMFYPLSGHDHDGPGGFIWASERTGFRHLYLYDWDGQLIRPLTQGEWQVDELAAVDEAGQEVYFLGSLDGPTERQLYAASMSGGQPRRITQANGLHTVTVDHRQRRFIDLHQALDRPPGVSLRNLADDSVVASIFDPDDAGLALSRDPRLDRLDLTPPELVSLSSRDGETLYGAIFRPPAEFGPGPYPTVVAVYGGPHAQLVVNGWQVTVSMRAQYLRARGYLVFVLDNRGSARRGLAFEGRVKHHMGDIEVRDQVDGVRWLVGQGLADPARVGIIGWSYGGYMAAMCLAQAPKTFQAAVAGAPVSHWDGYDTFYTERYMGTPGSNPSGYEKSSMMHHVGGVQGALLIVHGMLDENVHFRHTARLVDALHKAGKAYELLMLPNARHRVRDQADRLYLEKRIAAFFDRHLRT